MLSIQLLFAAETILLLVAGIAAILYLRSNSPEGMGLIYGLVFFTWALWAMVLIGVYLLTKEKTEPSPQDTTAPVSQTESLSILTFSDDGGKFGGKRKQNQRNRRTRRINRKNGVGHEVIPDRWQLAVIEWKEASNG